MTLIDPRAIPYELRKFVKDGVINLELTTTVQDVNRVQRIEAEPIRTAQFIRVASESLMCSGCGHLFGIPETASEKNVAWNYCPYCGAKLEVN